MGQEGRVHDFKRVGEVLAVERDRQSHFSNSGRSLSSSGQGDTMTLHLGRGIVALELRSQFY